MDKMKREKTRSMGLAAAVCGAGLCAELLCLAFLLDPRPGPAAPGQDRATGKLEGPFSGPAHVPTARNGSSPRVPLSGKAALLEEDDADMRDAVAEAATARLKAMLAEEPEPLTEWWLLHPRGKGGKVQLERKTPGWTVSVFGLPSDGAPTARGWESGLGRSLPGAKPLTGSGPLGAPGRTGRSLIGPASMEFPREMFGTEKPGRLGRTRTPRQPDEEGTGVRRTASRRSLSDWRRNKASATASAKPVFSAKPKPQPKTAGKAPVFKPILLSKLLGKNAIRPPKGKIAVPDLGFLGGRLPKALPDGTPLHPLAPEPGEVEAVEPPDPKAWAGQGPCPRTGHWHAGNSVLHYHDKEAWGRWANGRWTWLVKKESRWWVSAGPKIPTLLRHGTHWWWRTSGLWFLLHQGQPWGYRQLTDLGLDGLVHPASGTSMVYSEDGLAVALITPGQGAVLFDARTGEVLGRWTEDEMPKPRKPSAPSELTFPR
ncbi:MAG: hypothetical protein WC943_08745 [Elusimicrobiota bacterium]|jgi:hypothetical protein